MRHPFMDLSILIPTHNRAAVLRQTLGFLAKLNVPVEHRLELIVIANACTDATPQTVAECSSQLPYPARCVEEAQVGVAHARTRALAEARGEILFFLDDDIAVAPDWLVRHLEVHARHGADLVGGKIGLWFGERQPESWMLPLLESVLSWKDLGPEVGPVRNPGDCISGNLSLKRAAAERIGRFRTDLGRRAGALLGGEEIDFVARALTQELQVFYTPHALGRHWVPAASLELPYLKRLATGIGQTRVMMKKRLHTGSALRRLFLNPLRILGHLCGASCALLRRDKQAVLKHRIKRWKQQGGFSATVQRLFNSKDTET